MGSIGPAEILVVMVVALIVLGPTRLPDAARSLGKAVSEFRRVSSGLQAEVRDAFSEQKPAYTPPTPVSEPALPERPEDAELVPGPADEERPPAGSA